MPLGHQVGPLQRFLDLGVAQPDGMFLPQLFVKVPDVQVVVFLLYSRSTSSAVASGMLCVLGLPLRRSTNPV